MGIDTVPVEVDVGGVRVRVVEPETSRVVRSVRPLDR
jgi:hypothetical protein